MLLILCWFSVFAGANLSDEEFNNLLLCYRDKMSKTEGKGKFDVAFSRFPQSDLYKLFIDKERLAKPHEDEKHVEPHLIFDVREPGYYQGMVEAFELMSNQIGKPNTLDLIKDFHDASVGSIQKMRRGFFYDSTYYLKKPMDEDAKKEMLEGGVFFDPRPVFEMLSDSSGVNRECAETYIEGNKYTDLLTPILDDFIASFHPQSTKIGKLVVNILQKVERFICYHNGTIKKTTTLKGKLEAIAWLLRALEMAHIFEDGNQRTYAFILLNKLLIENNIPPAILEDPYMFDGYLSASQMVQGIEKGIRNFLNNNSEEQKNLLSECSENDDAQVNSYVKSQSDYKKLNYGLISINNFKLRLWNQVIESIHNNKVSDLSDNDTLYPLTKLVIIGDRSLIKSLIEHRLVIVVPPGHKFEESPLEWAFRLGNIKTAKALVPTKNAFIPQNLLSIAISKLATSKCLTEMSDALMENFLGRLKGSPPKN